MSLKFHYLADCPEQVATVIRWWSEVWADRMGSDLSVAEAQLRQSLNKTQLPIHLLAFQNGIPVATAALKFQELDQLYPDYQYWLGSVFVAKRYRNSRIASDISMKIVELARSRGLPHLYLQTINLNGGLYSGLGWKPVEKFSYKDEETLLMLKTLG